jgi:integrase
MSKIKDVTFDEVADKHLEMITKKTSDKDREYISKLKPFIGGLYMSELIRPKELGDPKHALNKYVLKRSKDNVTANTVNKELSILNTIGRKAVREYDLISSKCWENIRLLDESEENRLNFQPSKIKSHLEPEWEKILLDLMPPLTRDMAKFSIHTGQRESIVCNLMWCWLHTDTWDDKEISYFRVPKNLTKSNRHIKEDVFIVLNDVALFIISKYRNNNSKYVFTESGDPISKINNSSYQTARIRASFIHREIGNTDVHSFKRTFVTRLTEKEVPYVWVQRLANHKLSAVTEKYVKMSSLTRKVAWLYLQRIVTKGDRDEINQQNKESNEEHKKKNY